MAVWGLLLWAVLYRIRSGWMILVCVDVFRVRVCCALDVISQIMLSMDI